MDPISWVLQLVILYFILKDRRPQYYETDKTSEKADNETGQPRYWCDMNQAQAIVNNGNYIYALKNKKRILRTCNMDLLLLEVVVE